MRLVLPAAVILILVILLSPSVAAICAPNGRGTDLGFQNELEKIYFEASTGRSFLSLDSKAGDTDMFKPTAAGGPQAMALSVGGARPAALEFELENALTKSYWLNVSKPVVGAIYWSSTVANVAQLDGVRLRIELFANDTRVGGQDFVFLDAWAPFHFCFRPEVHELPAGSKLRADVTVFGSAVDIWIGTGGIYQSYVQFAYFDFDPLATGLYSESKTLYFVNRSSSSGDSNSAETAQDTGPTKAWAWILGLSPALALPGLGARKKGLRVVGVIILAIALAGCTSGPNRSNTLDGPGAPDTSGEFKVVAEQNETLREEGFGAVDGIIRNGNRAGLPIQGAFIAVPGTSLVAETDEEGTFEFRSLAANQYPLEVSADGFGVVRTNLTITVGTRLHLEVTLFRTNINAGKAHLHDEWGGTALKPFQDIGFLPTSELTGQDGLNGQWYCSSAGRCETPIPIDVSQRVLPGTVVVEVTLDWQSANAKELGLRVQTSAVRDSDQNLVPRGPGEAFRIAIFPNEADSGHQKHTDWAFWAVVPDAGSKQPLTAPIVNIAGEVKFKASIQKGVTPLEPAHPDFWAGRSEVILVDGAETKGCTGCDYPNSAAGFRVRQGMLVPPGTKELRGILSWKPATGASTSWGLVYKPGQVPDSGWNVANARPVSETGQGANSMEFLITPKADELDPFYQRASNWAFYPDDKQPAQNIGGKDYGTSSGLGTTWTLTVRAIRDPDWVDPDL